MKYLTILALVAMAVFAAACGGSEVQDSAPLAESEQTYVIGDTQEFQGLAITVLDAQNVSGGDMGLLRVKLRAVNNGDMETTFSPYDCALEEKLVHDIYDPVDSTLSDAPLSPGEEHVGWVYFDVTGPPAEYLLNCLVPIGEYDSEQLQWALDPPGTTEM